jgi:6-phosphogluconolactonase
MMDNSIDPNCQKIASAIARQLGDAIVLHGRASLVVCGGSSPLGVFAWLAQADINWAAVTITLADDRQVAADSPHSNIRLVRENLLIDKAAKAEFMPLCDVPADKLMPFDVVLLGMGPDGHIASLFPDMMDNADAFSLRAPPQILSLGAKGDPLLARISMNLSMLTNCHALLLLVKGAHKKALIQEVRAEAAAAPQRYPVGILLAQSKKTVQLCYLD